MSAPVVCAIQVIANFHKLARDGLIFFLRLRWVVKDAAVKKPTAVANFALDACKDLHEFRGAIGSGLAAKSFGRKKIFERIDVRSRCGELRL